MKRSPLRHELQAAIHNMDRMLRNGWSQRMDAIAVRNSMGTAQTFLNNNPAASDEHVREWCLAHATDLGRFIPQAHYRRLARLLSDALGVNTQAA